MLCLALNVALLVDVVCDQLSTKLNGFFAATHVQIMISGLMGPRLRQA